MSVDDRLQLEQIISQEHAKFSKNLADDKFFEIFSAEQVLKSRGYDLDIDQIVAGNTGKGDDGGADGFYVMVNGKMVREDTDLNTLKGQRLSIDVVVIQSKNKNAFGEEALKNFQDLTDNCLRLSADLSKASRVLYNQSLLESIDRFRTIYRNSLSDKPDLKIAFYYASRFDKTESDIHPKVFTRRDGLLETLRGFFSRADCTFEFAGAKKLYDWFNIVRPKTLTLEALKHLPGPKPGKSYVALVTLSKFYEFISLNGKLQDWIFEANVRDYQGDVQVNRQIAATLNRTVPEDFWWLNNGITIVASDVSGDGDFLTVTDALIVNGLQTSHVLYNYLSGINNPDNRAILVRVLESKDAGTTDRIIKATNSQTKIPSMWLHATEDIQREIEAELKKVGLFYDRRKNYYRNQGVSPSQIVTIPYLAQALVAIMLRRPDDARARPTTAAERHYKKLFSESFPKNLYSSCALIMKRVDEYLNGVVDTESQHKANMRFYLAMYSVCVALKSARPRRSTIAGFNMDLLTDQHLYNCLFRVEQTYLQLGGDDVTAKGPAVNESLQADLQNRFGRAKDDSRG